MSTAQAAGKSTKGPLPEMCLRPFAPRDEADIIALWLRCNLVRPQNNPALDIARKQQVNPELFLVGLVDNRIMASVMGGYEGHRGWVNYLAVDPAFQKRGLGRILMAEIEKRLIARGCPKLNLQVRNDNAPVIGFYEKIGYNTEPVTSLGKRLIRD